MDSFCHHEGGSFIYDPCDGLMSKGGWRDGSMIDSIISSKDLRRAVRSFGAANERSGEER